MEVYKKICVVFGLLVFTASTGVFFLSSTKGCTRNPRRLQCFSEYVEVGFMSFGFLLVVGCALSLIWSQYTIIIPRRQRRLQAQQQILQPEDEATHAITVPITNDIHVPGNSPPPTYESLMEKPLVLESPPAYEETFAIK